MRNAFLWVIAVMTAVVVILFAGSVFAQECIECHKKVTPNIVSDWELSKHSQKGVDCAVCHGDLHKSAGDAAKAKRPLPDTCAPCHEKQVEQFKKGKHAFAWTAQWAMPTAHWQPMALMEGKKGCGGCHRIGLKSEAEVKAMQEKEKVPIDRG